MRCWELNEEIISVKETRDLKYYRTETTNILPIGMELHLAIYTLGCE